MLIRHACRFLPLMRRLETRSILESAGTSFFMTVYASKAADAAAICLHHVSLHFTVISTLNVVTR